MPYRFFSLFLNSNFKSLAATSNLPFLSGRLEILTFRFRLHFNLNQRFPVFVLSCRFSITRRVSRLFSILLIMSITIFLALQWWYSWMNFFSIFKSVKSKLLILSMGVKFVVNDMIASACLRVKFVELAPGIDSLVKHIFCQFGVRL